MQGNPDTSTELPLADVWMAQEQLGKLLGSCLSLCSSCSQYHAQNPPSPWSLPKLSDSAALFQQCIVKQLFPSWAEAQVTKQRGKRDFSRDKADKPSCSSLVSLFVHL